ncbi:MAG: cytochrome c maturation protein CcmE [Chromatiales bacterium]|nr:cytochrome c maturation protein CcmE [Chromatiales bacterium]
MTPKRKKRLYLVLLLLMGIGTAAGLALNAFEENLLFFFSPAQVMAGEAPQDKTIRVGGLVVNGSVHREEGSLAVQFDLTDQSDTMTVVYSGILPDLFREGQGIVAKGRLSGGGVFLADEVLAKHDENYMPPEVADALKTAHNKGVEGMKSGTVMQ